MTNTAIPEADMAEDARTRMLGCRDGLSHALIAINSVITGPCGEYLPPRHHTRKRAAAEAQITELNKVRDAIKRQLDDVRAALSN
ncbi:hypothetical protein WNY61_09150 [Sulfitobacter sp. AS92]|uniref:hypothetical protein n=1 Tax=Sulfitobacter sp. AS92 TaxID=3135783 RepID=UPI0031808418